MFPLPRKHKPQPKPNFPSSLKMGHASLGTGCQLTAQPHPPPAQASLGSFKMPVTLSVN